MSQFVQPSLSTRRLSSGTTSFARDHIALDLASQRLDSYVIWADKELRTPSPPQHSSLPPLPHHPKQTAKLTEGHISFKGFADTSTDTDTSDTDNNPSASDPFNIPPPPIIRSTKARGPIKNFYVLIDTLPQRRPTGPLPNPTVTPPPHPKSLQHTQGDDGGDVLMDIMTSPSRSPVLVRRLDPPTEKVPASEILIRMGSDTQRPSQSFPTDYLAPPLLTTKEHCKVGVYVHIFVYACCLFTFSSRLESPIYATTAYYHPGLN